MTVIKIVYQADHKDFTSSDLKEDEVISMDPKLVSTTTNSEKRLNRNSGSLEKNLKNYGKGIKEEKDIENDENLNEEQRLNM